MKLLAVPAAALVALLMAFPVIFATGDTPGLRCVADDLAPILATIRHLESSDDYTAQADGSTASGAYQFIDATWNHYGGYPSASSAPPEIQDAKAAELAHHILDTHDGDIATIPVIWYIGHLPAPGSPTWDQIPAPHAGNQLTPREYQTRWLTEYDHQLQPADPDDGQPDTPPMCIPGVGIAPLADGFAYPGPADLFATADVDAPHHDYPAWDWLIPVGTPIYAVYGGRVATVQYWPHNWWDHGCQHDTTDCHTCGIGVTIEDDTGTRWAYCHGSDVHVAAGTTITAGTQLLTSGNTGRSGAPHLHLQIRTLDGRLRCPQPLLQTLRDTHHGLDPTDLPTSGCYF